MPDALRFLLFVTLASYCSELLADSSSEAIYIKSCAQCHGKDLRGGNAQSMVDGVWQYGRTDGDLTRNIKFGISAVGMPDYGKVLSDQEIRGLVNYIREAQEKADIKPRPMPEKLLTRHYDVNVEKWIAEGLDTPWSIVFLDDKNALVTERPGRLRVVIEGQLHPDPIEGTPVTLGLGQGGYMDLAVDPNYRENGWVYLAYTHAIGNGGRNSKAMTRVVRGRIENHQWVDQQVVLSLPESSYSVSRIHYGSRLAFDHVGHLLVTVGERGEQDKSQDTNEPHGKIHRVIPDGSIPTDNPFADGKQGLKTVFSYGHRNPQGLAVHPTTGLIWETEHGPMGGDEVNIVQLGKNYGWPKATYGVNYNGTIVSDDMTLDGVEPPVMYWVPSIAVCGADFVRGEEFPRWQHNLLVTGLGHEELRRLTLGENRVLHQEVLLKNAGRVRDVECGPDGSVYVLLNKPDMVLKLTNGGRAIRQ